MGWLAMVLSRTRSTHEELTGGVSCVLSVRSVLVIKVECLPVSYGNGTQHVQDR